MLVPSPRLTFIVFPFAVIVAPSPFEIAPTFTFASMSNLYDPYLVASVSFVPGFDGNGGVSKSRLLPHWQVEYFIVFSSSVSGFLLPA